MQLIPKGPDIPDKLLQAHEEGRLVFFCGAGISYSAGLPGFKELVDAIYRQLGMKRSEAEERAYASGRFDATLNLLEQQVPGRRLAVRKALMEVLKPKLRRKGATDSHAALLTLACDRENNLRLVTTNFDRIFDITAKRIKQSLQVYEAPFLPIPKDSRWHGLVYLHGALPSNPDADAFDRLVLSSGDFGLAYLTERWASRFVSELFRNYEVCFVGYSLNDPILRYMMDALVIDQELGESRPGAYVLAGCPPGKKQDKMAEWKAKGVIPILYEVPENRRDDHSLLHRTLKVWAETHRDGVLGKQRIVVEYALSRPVASTQQDDFVGRMLWALSDRSGAPAKLFADLSPVPPLEWFLEVFSKDKRFSFVMQLISGNESEASTNPVLLHIVHWLTRHLNDRRLIFWVTQQGGQLDKRWAPYFERKLEQVAELEREDRIDELDRLRSGAPNAVPSPPMRTLWRLLLTQRVKIPSHALDLFSWKNRLKRDGLTASVRLELRDLLAPKVHVQKPFFWNDEPDSTEDPINLQKLADCKLVLTTDDVFSALKDWDEPCWKDSLAALCGDLQQLLLDALDLWRELGKADDRHDPSHRDLPSISRHWQNGIPRDWSMLIELLRDSWLAVRELNPERATRIAQGWFELPYPAFKRLALFAATQQNCIPSKQWGKWLLNENAWWLWSLDLHREVMRLLCLQGRCLSTRLQQRLETAILKGPPRRPASRVENWRSLRDRCIWLRLAKLRASGLSLGEKAGKCLEDLENANPGWCFDSDEREEFLVWWSGTGCPDYERNREIYRAPRKRQELVQWLRQSHSESFFFYQDTWADVCRKHLLNTLCALNDLAREKEWPTECWQTALQTWSHGHEKMVRRSWRYLAPLIQLMPNEVLKENSYAISRWLEAVSESIEDENPFLDLCRRILDVSFESDKDMMEGGSPLDEPMDEAIRHPVGCIAQALLKLWFKRKPSDNDRLPADLEPFFTRICDTRVACFIYGRILLAADVIAFFRVDQDWTGRHLLPLFCWKVNPLEAKGAWTGFLWSPRIYMPLLDALKSQFGETARHYSELRESSSYFAAFLTYVALEAVEEYKAELQVAFEVLPQEGLEESSQALVQALEGAGDRREAYWKNRIYPFWHDIWPKVQGRISNKISERLIRLCIASGQEFPVALAEVSDWLLPLEYPEFAVHSLRQRDLCSQFPRDTLKLLNSILDDRSRLPRDFALYLQCIARASPELVQDYRYRKLVEYGRREGLEGL